MNGLVFEDQAPVVQSDPNRADIACFVGFVKRRNTKIPPEVMRWLSEQGWTAPPFEREGLPLFRLSDLTDTESLLTKLQDKGSALSIYLKGRISVEAPRLLDEDRGSDPPSESLKTALVIALNGLIQAEPLYDEQRFESVALTASTRARAQQNLRGESLVRFNRVLLEEAFPDEIAKGKPTPIDDLLDIPVPIDNWEVFDRLFAWERRDLDGRGPVSTTYLGAAVRSFFAQGGRKCYVVRVGDPWLVTALRAARLSRIKNLIPGYPISLASSPEDRNSWRGIGHLFGLPDVSFLCLPDLADAVGIDREQVTLPRYIPVFEEQFVECSEPSAPPPADSLARLFSAPRCGDEEYKDWANALFLATDLLARKLREVQVVASVPIPQAGLKPEKASQAERDLMEFFTSDGKFLSSRLSRQENGLSSAFLQLAYPWLRTPGSLNLPEQVESPDAVLAGLLARNALTRGAFRSAAGFHLADVFDLYPSLPRYQVMKRHADNSANSSARHTLMERVSLFGLTPGGFELLSDVTTSLNESYRPASVNRLVSVIVRAARRLGEDRVFESSGERLWRQLTESLNTLLSGLLEAGALRGETPSEAFDVRCDRSTMTQNDIDNGRVIAVVQFDAAVPIERITVILAMDEGGQVSQFTTGTINREAA